MGFLPPLIPTYALMAVWAPVPSLIPSYTRMPVWAPIPSLTPTYTRMPVWAPVPSLTPIKTSMPIWGMFIRQDSYILSKFSEWLNHKTWEMHKAEKPYPYMVRFFFFCIDEREYNPAFTLLPQLPSSFLSSTWDRGGYDF